jgi:arginine/lysine/ornithine decarboxylase
MIVPYPPGLPLIVAGERISSETVAAIRQFGSAGSRIVGLADPTAVTVRCVDEIGTAPSAASANS